LGKYHENGVHRAFHMPIMLEGGGIDKPLAKHFPLQHPSLVSMCIYHAHFISQAGEHTNNYQRVERCGLLIADIKPHMAVTPQFHPLENMEGKESNNLPEHSARLETLLDLKLHQYNRNNQYATLERNRPILSNSRTKHLENLESHVKTEFTLHSSASLF
jgi:hypothetical protein